LYRAAETATDGRQRELQRVVEIVASLAEAAGRRVQSGAVTEEAARAEFGRTVSAMTFNGGAEYPFVFDGRGIVIAHPN
ncbi:cache domain-containing protein, partial [Mycobacterium tuberculosis]|nr:cache domain-containing protein [Mycobacterium tuberculosis]